MISRICGPQRRCLCLCMVLATTGILTLPNPRNTLAQDDWQKLDDMPVGKWEAGTVVLDDNLYFFGGYTRGVRSSKRCDVFDPKDNSWRQIQDLPSAISHMNTTVDGRTVWFAGGFKDGYKGHTITFDGRIYVVGGQFQHDSMQLDQTRADIYDPQTDSWSRGPQLPKGHSHSEGGTFVSGGRIYMIGGHTTPEGGRKQISADILALTPDGQWELVGELPMPLSSPAAAIIHGKLYVAGGSRDGRSVQADMWVRDAP